MPRGVYPRPSISIRFWSKVVKTDGCWLWQGSVFRYQQGGIYGAFYLNGQNRAAHRVSYEMAYGEIPDGLNVLHHCDTPLCVRPDHLFLGIQADNMEDMVAKGRSLTGERHPNSRYHDADVVEMRLAYAKGNVTMKQLRSRFGGSLANIYKIIRAQVWTHLP